MSYQNYPTTYELYAKYKEYREKYFDNLIPLAHEVTIEWCSRLSSVAGKCYTTYDNKERTGVKYIGKYRRPNGVCLPVIKQTIKLSTQYHSLYPQDTYKTLLHEMIHLLIGGHGPEFHNWMERIRQKGGEVERYCKKWKHLKEDKWLYECQLCGKTWKKSRRIKSYGRSESRIFGCPDPCGGKVVESKIPSKS